MAAAMIIVSNLLNTDSPSARAYVIALCGVAGLICTVGGVLLIINCFLERRATKEALHEAEQAREAESQTAERHRTARVVDGVIYNGANPTTGRSSANGSLDAIVSKVVEVQPEEAASRVKTGEKRSQPKGIFGRWRRVRGNPIDCESQTGTAPATKPGTEPGLAEKMVDERKENIFVAFWDFLRSWARVERSV